jgi:hypothetical protein
MDTVGAAPSSAGASTYIRLYAYIAPMLYFIYIYVNSVNNTFVRTTKSTLLVT